MLSLRDREQDHTCDAAFESESAINRERASQRESAKQGERRAGQINPALILFVFTIAARVRCRLLGKELLFEQ
jgi:hypothetical protein